MTERMGIGPHAMWGFSPAMDLLDRYLKHHPPTEGEQEKPINVLLVNPNDVRHVLRTIAVRARHFSGASLRPVHVSKWRDAYEALWRGIWSRRTWDTGYEALTLWCSHACLPGWLAVLHLGPAHRGACKALGPAAGWSHCYAGTLADLAGCHQKAAAARVWRQAT